MFSCWVERNATLPRRRKTAWVPFPWWTSKSTISTFPIRFYSACRDGDGDIVEQAEAHGGLRLGVVSRRADDGKGILRPACQHCACAVQRCAGSQEGIRIGARRDKRGGVVGDARSLAAGGFEIPQHPLGVDSRHGFARRAAGLESGWIHA